GALIFTTRYSYTLSFVPSGGEPPANALRLWSDYGFCVFFIGIGYYFVARDVSKNHGLIWLGIISKIFDAVNLTSRFAIGVTTGLALIPAAIEVLFVILFVLFLYRYRRPRGSAGRNPGSLPRPDRSGGRPAPLPARRRPNDSKRRPGGPAANSSPKTSSRRCPREGRSTF
ncbi:MAG: hypothetical protein V3T83_14295, partial [Acidobacteriota bacterium]